MPALLLYIAEPPKHPSTQDVSWTHQGFLRHCLFPGLILNIIWNAMRCLRHTRNLPETLDSKSNTVRILWERHLCVLVCVTQQVSKSVMAVVPEGYCLTKPWLKGSVVTAENVGRINGEIQYVSLSQSGFLSLHTLYKGQFKKVIRKKSSPFESHYLTYFRVTCVDFSK